MKPTTGRPSTVTATNMAEPMPNIGSDPETPTTSIAQERIERNASGHEHMLCPAPESTWNVMCSGDGEDIDTSDVILAVVVSAQGRHRHSAVPGTKVTAALTMGRGPLSVEGEKTTFWVASSNLTLSPVLRSRCGVLPDTHS
jgi:hypothetical protein